MNFFLIVLIILFSKGLQFAEKNSFYDDYCSLRKTNAIKGIFVMAIFLSHSMDYLNMGESDVWVRHFSEYLRQLIVVPLFFYSGFGIMESIQKKGIQYIKNIPVNKILKTILYADVAVLIFALLYLLLDYNLTFKQFFLSLIFWDKIENNTWYFFVIVFLYLFTYISFRIFPKNYFIAAFCTAVFSLGLFYFLIQTRSIIWYNTFYVYHFGMWYSLLREKIEKLVMRNDLIYGFAMVLAFIAYTFFRNLGSFYYFIICGCFMMTVIVGITMKVSIDNPFLQYLGQNVMGIYAFHRLPMMLVCDSGMDSVSRVIFSMIATAVLCSLFEFIKNGIDFIILLFSTKKSIS